MEKIDICVFCVTMHLDMCVANCQRFHISLIGVDLSCFKFISKVGATGQRRGNFKTRH